MICKAPFWVLFSSEQGLLLFGLPAWKTWVFCSANNQRYEDVGKEPSPFSVVPGAAQPGQARRGGRADPSPQKPTARERWALRQARNMEGRQSCWGAKGMGQRRLQGRLALTPNSRGCEGEEGARPCGMGQQRGRGARRGQLEPGCPG